MRRFLALVAAVGLAALAGSAAPARAGTVFIASDPAASSQGLATFTGSIMTAVVLAAACDYAVFLISRYHEFRREGLEPRLAAAMAGSRVSGVVIGSDPLKAYGEHAPELVARVSEFPRCADVVINSRYDPRADEAGAFEPHVGSHGGLGGPQHCAVLVHPRSFAAPEGEIVGAEQLHLLFRRWLTDLGHPEPAVDDDGVGPQSRAALERVRAGR